MRKFTIVFGVLIIGLTLSIVLGFTPSKTKAAQEDSIHKQQQLEYLATAKALLDEGKTEEALAIIGNNKKEMETLSENGVRWLDLLVRASTEARDIPQLVILFEFFPEIFKEHETASLLVADSYISSNRVKDYRKIRSLWEDRETQIATWYILDVDGLLLEGRRQDAMALLQSRTFKNKADAPRLVRLALLTVDKDPKTAWKHLGEAYSKDPKNPDIRSYRAKLLENAGKYTLAHKEYQAAIRLEPENLFLKDQLAEFYLRQKQYPMAVEVLQDTLTPPSLDQIWIKTLFWQKVTTPIGFNWEETPAPQGKLEPLIQYLSDLGPHTFWDESMFERLPNNTYYLRKLQETFWLRLLSALKDKKEKQAQKLLKYNPFQTTSWFPELETTLKRILAYRRDKTLKVENPIVSDQNLHATPLPKLELPLLFQELEQLAASEDGKTATKVPESLHNLLVSDEIFSAVFLAVDWFEAGLQLHKLPVIPNDFPDWVAVNITKAIDTNRTTTEAIEFASMQKPTPEISLLTAKLLIAGGDSTAALEKLNKLTKFHTDIGYQAAWLASLIYIEQKDWEKAKNAVVSHPQLVQEVLGQETLARIAHLQGDTDLATKLYTSIEQTSPEARSYLARKAFAEKDWERAKKLTERLIVDYPENMMLQENLNKIIEEMHQSESVQ